jgi:hypothetical protein
MEEIQVLIMNKNPNAWWRTQKTQTQPQPTNRARERERNKIETKITQIPNQHPKQVFTYKDKIYYNQ